MEAKAYEITGNELRQLQMVELEMLIEMDRICKKNGIKYSLDGGTLLGAVRHKGFIPWDDDIDVIMLREEYVKFRRACAKDLDTTRFFFQDYRTDPGYRWGYAKFRRKGTKFVRLGQEHLKQNAGVFMDIFVVDNVPDGYLSRRLHHFACFLVRKTLYSEVGKQNEKKPFLRVIYRGLSRIPRDMVFHIRNCLAAPLSRTRTELISHYTLEYPRRCRYGLPRECFDEMTALEFEGRSFPCFKKYDLYLSSYYGDYMTLPPKEKQVPHLTVSALELIEPEIEKGIEVTDEATQGFNYHSGI